MRITRPSFADNVASGAFVLLLFAGALPAQGAGLPQPVSPGAATAGAVAELRCPTFSWSGIEGARGYELAVFRVPQAPGAEPIMVTRATVSGDARSWTPALDQCLERFFCFAITVVSRHEVGIDSNVGQITRSEKYRQCFRSRDHLC